MVKLKSYSLNLGYPVYGAQFANDNTLIVAGGGGDGNNGIPNKMTAILIQPENLKKPIKRYRELTLNENEDSVMSLGVGNGTILAGINENPLMMAKGVNKHLRKFKFENDHLKFVESCQIHPNTNSTIYQKITAISNDGSIGVIVMSDTPSSIYIIETAHDLEEKFKIVTDGDVKDVTISLDGKLMCYITSSVFEVISLVTGRSVYKTTIDFLMSKIRFLDNNEVIISGAKNKDTVIAKFSIASSKIIHQKIVFKNLKGITSMDVNIKNNLTVLATSNYSLLIVRTSDLKVIKVLNKVHDFAITKVVFSKSGSYLASCSAANTVNVVEIPANFAASKSILATVFQYIFSIIMIAFLSVGVQYLYENGYINVAYSKALEIYEHYKPQDSSGYFTVESISSFHHSSTTTVNSPSSSSSPSFSSSSNSYSSTSSAATLSFTESVSILESSIIEKASPSSEVLTSILKLTSSVMGDTKSTNSGTITSTSSTSTTVVSSETTSAFDPADSTINNDIISYNELTTSLDFLPSTSFLSEANDVTEKGSSSNVPTQPIKTTLTSALSNSVTKTDDGITVTSSFPTFSPTSLAQVKEITKEIIKEITSIVFATQTEFSTTVQTSTALFTSVHTSVATKVETEFAKVTSFVVETLTKELTITLPGSSTLAVASDVFSSTTAETQNLGATTNAEELVKTSNITSTYIKTTTIQTTLGSEASTTASTEGLKIQIEPSKDVYDDPAEAMRSQEEQVKQILETETETSASESAVSSSSQVYSIEIEPSSLVFEHSEQAIEEERKLVESELVDVAPTPETKVTASLDMSKDVYTAPSVALSDVTEIVSLSPAATTSATNESVKITTTFPFKGESSAVTDVPSASGSLDTLIKDEL
ncbi:hypothetical protein PMKS-004073 [Pichia membranifaciens]|uniref:Guanine nucleotide-exchange factor SEC12 n=1 Tax=Pichia membranifaciens TaxID=4926 RepID=A0A1Q2YM03_9ASCO|nr:hypothetical protein PMKS-004073 [Pichia membranifaciens]